MASPSALNGYQTLVNGYPTPVGGNGTKQGFVPFRTKFRDILLGLELPIGGETQSAICDCEGPPITAREIPPSVHNRGLLNDTRGGNGGLQGAVVDRFRGKADIDFFW